MTTHRSEEKTMEHRPFGSEERKVSIIGKGPGISSRRIPRRRSALGVGASISA